MRKFGDMSPACRLVLQIILISAACVVYAGGLVLFLDPNDLAPGGISGVAIMISRFVPLGVGTIILMLNVPLIIVAYVKFGARFTLMTLYALVLSSAIMDIMRGALPADYAVTHDRLLAAAAGGGMMALGLGVIFRAGGTTGGSDIIIRLLRRKFRYVSTGTIFLIFDCLIVGISAVVFGNIETALYAGAALAVHSAVLDRVLYGGNGARMIFIVTTRPDEITAALCDRINISCTLLRGEGGYSHHEKAVLLVVSKKHVYPKIRDAVGAADPTSFMIVSSASEIFGKGYRSLLSSEL